MNRRQFAFHKSRSANPAVHQLRLPLWFQQFRPLIDQPKCNLRLNAQSRTRFVINLVSTRKTSQVAHQLFIFLSILI